MLTSDITVKLQSIDGKNLHLVGDKELEKNSIINFKSLSLWEKQETMILFKTFPILFENGFYPRGVFRTLSKPLDGFFCENN